MIMLETLHKKLAEEGVVTFSIRVRPGASHSEVVSVMSDGSVKITIAAPAQEGRANEELLRVLAETFGTHPQQVEILAGGGGRRKIVRISR